MSNAVHKIKDQEILLYKRRRYARRIVASALATGKLTKSQCCHLCKEQRRDIEAHHVDYGKPLDVVWLCKPCHGLAHRDDHELNPNLHPQSAVPFLDENNTVAVSFLLPVRNFLALQKIAQEKQTSVSKLISKQILEKYPANVKQLDLFEAKNDYTQQKKLSRVSLMDKDEKRLHEQEFPRIPELWRPRRDDLQGLDGKFFSISGGHGPDAERMQRNRANR